MNLSALSVLAVCHFGLYYRNLYKALNSGGVGGASDDVLVN